MSYALSVKPLTLRMAAFDRCKLKNNDDGAVVGMSSSKVTLNDCLLAGSKGAAIELHNTSQLCMRSRIVTQCAGLLATRSCKVLLLSAHTG